MSSNSDSQNSSGGSVFGVIGTAVVVLALYFGCNYFDNRMDDNLDTHNEMIDIFNSTSFYGGPDGILTHVSKLRAVDISGMDSEPRDLWEQTIANMERWAEQWAQANRTGSDTQAIGEAAYSENAKLMHKMERWATDNGYKVNKY